MNTTSLFKNLHEKKYKKDIATKEYKEASNAFLTISNIQIGDIVKANSWSFKDKDILVTSRYVKIEEIFTPPLVNIVHNGYVLKKDGTPSKNYAAYTIVITEDMI